MVGGINAVTLSKTKKKGREHKKSMVDLIRQAVENYNSIYVFTVENMRNLKFKELREQLKSTSRQVVFSDFLNYIFTALFQILISDENITSFILFGWLLGSMRKDENNEEHAVAGKMKTCGCLYD